MRHDRWAVAAALLVLAGCGGEREAAPGNVAETEANAVDSDTTDVLVDNGAMAAENAAGAFENVGASNESPPDTAADIDALLGGKAPAEPRKKPL